MTQKAVQDLTRFGLIDFHSNWSIRLYAGLWRIIERSG
jgi:hypothetical protein